MGRVEGDRVSEASLQKDARTKEFMDQLARFDELKWCAMGILREWGSLDSAWKVGRDGHMDHVGSATRSLLNAIRVKLTTEEIMEIGDVMGADRQTVTDIAIARIRGDRDGVLPDCWRGKGGS